MTYSPPQFEELADLVWALANDRLDADGASSLRLLLESDAANRRVYSELMDQFALLEWERGEGEGRGIRGEGRGTWGEGWPVHRPLMERRGSGFGNRESGFKVRDLSLLVRRLNCRQANGPEARSPNPQSRRSSSIFPPLPTAHYPLATFPSAVGRSPAWSPR